jgi:DNA-directed RNA polymerase specialized sigma24 family protein
MCRRTPRFIVESLTFGRLAIARAELKKHWTPSTNAFRQLLTWLDGDVDSGGENYLEMRRRLVGYFGRKNCLSADDLADETLNRVARRLEEEGVLTAEPAARYCYVTARFVFLEHIRRTESNQGSVEALAGSADLRSSLAAPADPDDENRRKLLNCLERCLEKLQPRDHDLILEYYRGEQRAKIENRRELAARLGLTINAVSIRACRIRDALELCVRTCHAEG